MADSKNTPGRQMSLAEYEKIKEKRAQTRLKLHFPWPVRILLGIPLSILIFLIIWYLVYVRFIAEHS